jgi:hypothetical protein
VAAVGLEPTTYGLLANTQIPLKSGAFPSTLSAELGAFWRSCYYVVTTVTHPVQHILGIGEVLKPILLEIAFQLQHSHLIFWEITK